MFEGLGCWMGSGARAGEGREAGRDMEQPQNTKNTCVSRVFHVLGLFLPVGMLGVNEIQ